MARIARIAAAVLLLAASAGCEEDRVNPVIGHAEWVNPDGTPIVNAAVDFGPVLVGTRVQRSITLANLGLGTLKVGAVHSSEGLPASVRFELDRSTLARGDRATLTFTFEPLHPAQFEARLVFALHNADDTQIAIDVRGYAVDGGCAVEPSDRLDFGSVPLGERFTRHVKVINPSDLPWKVAVAALAETLDSAAFPFPSVKPGEHVVPAHGELVIPVEFRPNHPGLHTAVLELPAPAMCQRSITLVGNGLEHVLDCEPKVIEAGRAVCRVDFGFVNPGARASSKFVLRNLGNVEVRVSGVRVQPTDYVALTPSREFTIPGGGSLDVPVDFTPTVLGVRRGSVTFSVASTRETTATVELAGIGGGPDIEVRPSSIDFGTVGVGGSLTRRITIANAGVNVADTLEDNLRLGELVDGAWQDRPPEIAAPGSGDFEITGVDYLPAGIEAPSSIDLHVRFRPSSVGARQATLVVYSNDPDEGRVEIPLGGRGEDMPPCEYEVLPPRLPFGIIEPGHSRTLPVTFVNKSANRADSCTIYGVELASGGPSGFSLPATATDRVLVPGGARLSIPVRFVAGKSGSYTGLMTLFTSSAVAPHVQVPLSATVQMACLMVAPADLDYGTTRMNCTTQEKDVTLYNTCATPIHVASLDLQGGNAYSITQRPPLPLSLQPGELMLVKLNFRPTSEWDDNALLLVRTQLPDAHVVSLTGRGSSSGFQTDVFAQEARPKVDTLLVVDNSASMANEQAALGQNFQSLIRYAEAQHVDYHLAVTTTAVDAAHGNTSNATCSPQAVCEENGRFVPVAAPGPRVITPATPNAEQVFMQNVNVGTSGHSKEMLIRPAHLALTNPLLTGHNAGFLRDEAVLSIVVVSDAADQDATPTAVYESFFANLKGPYGRNRVSFSAIVPTQTTPATGCDYDDRSAAASPRVRELVTRTAGVYEEICTPNWSRTLERLGDRVWGLRTKFFLSNPVDGGHPITMTVDGAEYAQAGSSGTVRWTYDSRENAVVFDPVAVPEPGATIAVTYRIACN